MKLRSFPLFAALSLLLMVTACSKEELVVPAEEATSVADPKSNGGPGTVNGDGGSDPTNGGISDDGDDQGDNEGPRKRKKP